MNTLVDLITEFLDYVEIEKNQSMKTIRNYQHYLGRFVEFAGNIEPKDIDLKMVQKYRVFLNRYTNRNDQPLSRKTQNYHVIALRAFLKYLVRHDYDTLAPEKIDLNKAEARTVEFLSREELDEIFNAVDTSKKAGKRDIAILHLLYSTGLRISELVALNRSNINLERKEFMVVGKGRKPRIVFVSDDAAEYLKTYVATREDNFEPLFINYKRGKTSIDDGESRRLSAYSIQALVRKYARLAGIVKKVTPHTLRHSFATNMLQNGADIRSVQELLGHASITTTQIYTHLTNKRLREIHEKYHA